MKYDYLLNKQRPESSRRKMSAYDRAAQFSAFAALVGLDDQINETARIVGGRIELSEDEADILNRKLRALAQTVNENGERPQVRICRFIPDKHKDGGAYITEINTVKRVDEVFFKIRFSDGTEINISDILDLEITDPA